MLIYVKSKRFKQTVSLDTLNIRRNKTICQFEGMKLDHRNYLDLNEKTCLGLPTMQDSNQPTQLQRLARMLLKNIVYSKFINYTLLGATNKGADQTARMCRLVCAFDVRMQLRQVFSRHGP